MAVIVAEAGICRTWVTLLSPPLSLHPRSLAGIRDPVSRLVPWPSTPRMLPASLWVGAGRLHLGLGGGEGVLAGRWGGERFLQQSDPEVGGTPRESLVHPVGLNGQGRDSQVHVRPTPPSLWTWAKDLPRTRPVCDRLEPGVHTLRGHPGRHIAFGACPSSPAFSRLALHPEPVFDAPCGAQPPS